MARYANHLEKGDHKTSCSTYLPASGLQLDVSAAVFTIRGLEIGLAELLWMLRTLATLIRSLSSSSPERNDLGLLWLVIDLIPLVLG